MWVVQESFFSAVTTVYWGQCEIKWEIIQDSSWVIAQTGLDTLLKAYFGYATQSSRDVDAAKLPDNRLSNQSIFSSLQRLSGEALSLGQLLYYSRFFEASDPRDKVFAILGLWKFKRGDRAGQIDIWPDYNKSVLEVYVEATTAAIQESRTLDILSLVDGDSSENPHELPSWVPDYTQGPRAYSIVPPLAPNPPQLCLHANFEDPTDSKVPSLAVQGIEIDVVQDIGPTYSEIMNKFELRALLNLLFTYAQPHYPTDGSPNNAFWRTLIKDTFRGSPADREAQLAFPTFIMQRIREMRQQVENLEEFEEPKLAEELGGMLRETEIIIRRLAGKCSEEKTIPTLKEIRDMIKVEETVGSAAEQKLESDRKDIEESFRVAYFRRRLFRTARGYFGIALQSIVPGDRVWVLAGARVPFVLKAADAEEGRWRLVSEAYVHGVMHSDALADTGSLKRIYLV
ncbi:hypothetical protein ONZ43_g6158 [Nemania bipapillata]|uniref:Uncharacterized protein n=1 Tax=Nemania bipapillata TaxID=110536 RepID=A0ACC2I287_9PEZI|nr:hypothetical protein ONZ43_g6158 [Nemania bipapillata]